MENLSGMLFPIGTMVIIVLVQISFWFPTENKQKLTSDVPRHTNAISTGSHKTENLPKVGKPSKERDTPVGAISKRMRITAQDIQRENFHCIFIKDESSKGNKTNENKGNEVSDRNVSKPPKTEDEGRIWKCACEFGILPIGILRTFGNAEAMMRLGVGQCYHKK